MRATLTLCAVVAVFLRHPDSELCGTDVMSATELGPGTVYPCLTRLKTHRVITAVPDTEVDHRSDGYSRIWYRLADRAAAEKLVARRAPSLRALRVALAMGQPD